MIAASIALAFALYFTGALAVQVHATYVRRAKGDYSLMAAIAAASWGLFYYFTHA